MNLLVISPVPSSPANQGNRQRIHGVCKAFQERGATVHFGYLPREWGGHYDAKEHAEMTDQWDFYDTIIPSEKISYGAAGEHHKIDEWWDDAIGRYVRHKCTGVSFDACLVNYAFFSKAFEALPPHVTRILDTHDRLSGRREMLEQHGVAPEFFYTTSAEEQIALNRADIVLAITPEEAAVFRTMTDKPVVTLGHLVKSQKPRAITPAVDRVVRVGFIGSTNSVNAKNLSDFFQVLSQSSPHGIPCVEFHIYGRCCSQIQIPPECRTYVHLHGQVEDLSAAYAAIDCVFIPFMFGTGQKIKLIEALSFGKPLIATVSASEGSGSKSYYHQLTSHESVVDAIRRFVGDLGFRSKLLANSYEAFAAYEANINRATDALFATVNARSLQVRIEPAAVAAAFQGLNRADVVDQACRVVSMLDVLDGVSKLKNKDIARRALFQGAEAALAERTGEQIEWQPPCLKLADHGCGAAVFSGLTSCDSAPQMTSGIRVVLPSSATSQQAPQAQLDEIYIDCRPPAEGPETRHAPLGVLHTPTPEHRSRTFKGYQHVLVLSDDIRSPSVIAQIRSFEREARHRFNFPFAITSVDREGRRAKWVGDTLAQIRPTENLEQAIGGALDLPRKLPSIALAVGFSYISASSFHRLLLADCGPMISLMMGRVHAVDGEVVVRTPHEAAIWCSRFLVAPRWGSNFARRLRASLSALEGAETQVAKIGAAYRAQNDKRMSSIFAELLLYEN